MTAMEAVIFCINPVMGHVSQMVKWLVMVLALKKTLHTSTKITVSAMEHVKVNVSHVMMEAVWMDGRHVETTALLMTIIFGAIQIITRHAVVNAFPQIYNVLQSFGLKLIISF